MKQRMILCGVLVILIFAAHAPTLQATFVWDDTALVLRDPLIRSWRLIPEGFQRFLFVDATPSNFYRPVQRLSYTLEYWAFAFRPAPYHLTNILLHAAAAIALYIFALAFLRLYQVDERKSLGIAAIASLAWALHPLHSGVVDYVAGRADSLAALFGFTALYFTVRALDRESAWKFYGVTGFALLASALSKDSGLIFSALAITLILLRKNWKGIVPIGVAIAFVLTIYVTLRNQVPPVDVPRLSPPAPALVRPIIAARALAEYAGLLIAPANLHMDRDVENHPWGFNPVSLTAGAWRELETLAGLIVFPRTIAAGGYSARMLINLGGLELSDGHLEPADMFLQRALAKNPEQPFALLNLAALALKRNDLPTARGFLKRAQKNPLSLAQAEEMLALVEQKEKGQIDLPRLRIASQTDPPSWSIMRRYLAALSVTGQTKKAVSELRTLLNTEWYRAESWQLLSEYLTRLGQVDEAAETMEQA